MNKHELAEQMREGGARDNERFARYAEQEGISDIAAKTRAHTRQLGRMSDAKVIEECLSPWCNDEDRALALSDQFIGHVHDVDEFFAILNARLRKYDVEAVIDHLPGCPACQAALCETGRRLGAAYDATHVPACSFDEAETRRDELLQHLVIRLHDYSADRPNCEQCRSGLATSECAEERARREYELLCEQRNTKS